MHFKPMIPKNIDSKLVKDVLENTFKTVLLALVSFLQGPRHEFQGGVARSYKSNLNLVLQNRGLFVNIFALQRSGGGAWATLG